jgi:hypothetical protein
MIYKSVSLVFFCLSLATYASLFILASSSIGHIFLVKIRQNPFAIAFLACLGVTPLLIGLWYVQQTGLELWLIGLWLILGTIALIKVMLVPAFQGDVKIQTTIKQVGITALLISFIMGCFGGPQQPATFGNNDLFNWYAVASTLIGKARYSEMSAEAPIAFISLIVDGFGTNWMLALLGLTYDEPIRSATLFLVVSSCWLSLTLQWHLSSFFRLSSTVSILSSVIPITSSLFIYAAFNSFFAQLLGTIGCALLIAVAMHIYTNKNESYATRILMIFVPVLWILCVYQSGFVAFQFIAVSFAFFLFLSSGLIKGCIEFAKRFLFPYVIALILSAAVIPSVIGHLIERTSTVSDIIAGWPLPLFPSHVFLGLPWPDAGNMWLVSGGEGGQVWGYLYFGLGVILVLSIHNRNSLPFRSRTLVMLWVWYMLLITTYFVWFHMGKTQYQNWKFASFFIFAISSLPLATFILLIKKYFSPSDWKWHLPSIPYVIIAIGLGITFLINFNSLNKRTERIGSTVEEFSLLRGALEPGMALSLDLADYGPSMLAMLMFSRTARTYPIGQTYLPPATQFGSESNRGLLTSVACDKLFSQLGYIDRDIQLARTKNFVVSKIMDTTRFGYRFNDKGGACGWGRKFHFDSGFSVPESWGRWTEGELSQLTIELPTGLVNRTLRADFLVQPYLPAGQLSQLMIININEKKLFAASLDSPKIVSIDIPAVLNTNDKLLITLNLPDAVSPSIMEPGNKDTRKLGVGFVSLGIKAINIENK